MFEEVHIVGGGLAGSEAAWQIARAGLKAILYEMRPIRQTPAHKTDQFAELVCSNSLKSEQIHGAPWLLKEELRRMESLLIGQVAPISRVPAGHALTVDRDLFAREVTRLLSTEPRIEIRREEVTTLDPEKLWIIASGPLTSEDLAREIAKLTGSERLFFYDSISPIVDAESIDRSIVFDQSRYGKSIDGTDDYVNCPFTKEQYETFLDALLASDSVPAHIPQDSVRYFEACLPIEEIARRGRDTLRFGPMKPMGLTDPHTGRRPYAVVQLRAENARAGSYNLVGFQNHMRFAEQQRVLRLIPGLERAEFLRFGQVHRNTYINAPALLNAALQLRTSPNIFFAGQISGVEGYVESIATGLAAALGAVAVARGQEPRVFPRSTALGSLCAYVSGADPKHYQPTNITFDLLPKLERPPKDKKQRQALVCERALAALDQFLCVHV
jgi:methylenetetrahydrofolate--tRNA-(uracil-5-)-methyltransferase